MRARTRRLNYSIRTEDACVDWARRFVFIHVRRHQRDLSATEVEVFLTHLVIAGKMSALIRDPAKSAPRFHYRQVLKNGESWLTDIASVRQGRRLPGVRALTHDGAARLRSPLQDGFW